MVISKDEEQYAKKTKLDVLKDYSEDENETNEIYLENEEIEDKKDEEYINMLRHIQKNMFQYIEKTSIPVGEFLSLKNIHNFIHQS